MIYRRSLPLLNKDLAARLIERKRQPVDLLGNERDEHVHNLADTLDSERLFRLLDRGLLSSQAIDQWQSRGIWIVSRADATYPRRLKAPSNKRHRLLSLVAESRIYLSRKAWAS